jgi:hypothetical protein
MLNLAVPDKLKDLTSIGNGSREAQQSLPQAGEFCLGVRAEMLKITDSNLFGP